jgi:hypothetical protein
MQTTVAGSRVCQRQLSRPLLIPASPRRPSPSLFSILQLDPGRGCSFTPSPHRCPTHHNPISGPSLADQPCSPFSHKLSRSIARRLHGTCVLEDPSSYPDWVDDDGRPWVTTAEPGFGNETWSTVCWSPQGSVVGRGATNRGHGIRPQRGQPGPCCILSIYLRGQVA